MSIQDRFGALRGQHGAGPRRALRCAPSPGAAALLHRADDDGSDARSVLGADAPPVERLSRWAEELGVRQAPAGAALRQVVSEAERAEHDGARRVIALMQMASGRARTATRSASACPRPFLWIGPGMWAPTRAGSPAERP